jgi:hypothetical protein
MDARADLPWTVGQWRGYLRGYSAEVLDSEDLRLAVEQERVPWLTRGRRVVGWFAEVEAGLLDAWADSGMPFLGEEELERIPGPARLR